MVFRAFHRKPQLPPDLRDIGSGLKEAKKALASAQKTHSTTVKGIRKELREAEREHERAVRAAQNELEARRKERTQRIQGAKKRYDSIRSTLAPMETARFGKSVLYEDRVVTKQGEALLQRGITALADTAAKITISRPGAVARLAASGAVNGRAFRSAQGYDARRFYLLIEAPELVALLPCRAGDEQAAKEFAARVNVAALNARRIEREREETLGDARHELDAAESHQDAVLAADDALARAVANTEAIDLARARLAEAEADTGAIAGQRDRVAALELEYGQGVAVEQERLAEEQRSEDERRLEEKRRAEEERLEAERRAQESQAAAEDVDARDSEISPDKAADSDTVRDSSNEAVDEATAAQLRETIVIMETVETAADAQAAGASRNGESVDDNSTLSRAAGVSPDPVDEAESRDLENTETELLVGGEAHSPDASADKT